MAVFYTYKLWCETEQAWVYWTLDESADPPTKCPNNTAHTVDLGSRAIDSTDSDTFPVDPEGHQIITLPVSGLSGVNAVTTVNVPINASNLSKSWQLSTPANTLEILDIHIWGDLIGPLGKCYLAGGTYKCRTEAAENSALNFAVVDRDDVLGYFVYYGLTRTQMFLSDVSGTPEVDDTVTGGTSGQTARVLAVNGTTLDVTFANGPFTDGEAVTFSGGATATCDDWVEGDVLELKRPVKDEWIEGLDEGEYRPGDSSELPAGMYFRVLCFNASLSDDLRIKIKLDIATE